MAIFFVDPVPLDKPWLALEFHDKKTTVGQET